MQQPSPTDGPNLQTSAEELDRLTNEILSRVSQIGEDRKQRIELAAADLAAAEAKETSTQDPDSEPENDDEPFAGIDLTRRADSGHASQWSDDESMAESSESSDDAGLKDSDEHVDAVTTLHSTPAPRTATADRSESHQENESSGLPGLGHILSYVGILGLTAGTSLVIVGYFGGPATYAPTGWLVSTIGQMLLFLGIVTLVSNGMEQTSDELQKTVNTRLDELTSRMETVGDRLIRIEAAEKESLRRPHLVDRSERQRTQESTSLRE